MVTVKSKTRFGQYMEYRRNGDSAQNALRRLTSWSRPSNRPQWNGEGKLRWKQGGFDLTARTEMDDNPDLSFIGSYSNTWQPGVFDRLHGREGSCREYRYFVPSDLRGTIEESRRWFTQNGYSRHDAYTKAMSYNRQDFERMEAYNSGDWFMVGVIVTAYRKGVELGSASVWGVESDSGEYFGEIAADLAAEAIGEAQAKMEALCCCDGEEE